MEEGCEKPDKRWEDGPPSSLDSSEAAGGVPRAGGQDRLFSVSSVQSNGHPPFQSVQYSQMATHLAAEILKILKILKVAWPKKFRAFSPNVERDAGFESIRIRMTPRGAPLSAHDGRHSPHPEFST